MHVSPKKENLDMHVSVFFF